MGRVAKLGMDLGGVKTVEAAAKCWRYTMLQRQWRTQMLLLIVEILDSIGGMGAG